jgi:glycine cleavage system H protein
MTAGLVSYKICDHDFDCESCPLDEGLRGREPRREGDSEVAGDRDDALDFPDDRLYHPSHTWAMSLQDGSVRIGIDAFAANLLARAGVVILPAEGSQLRQGRVGCWLMEDTRPVPLLAPLSGKVLRRNQRVQKSPRLVTDSPYGAGWLLEADCADRETEWPALLDAARLRVRVQRQMTTFRNKVSQFLEPSHRTVGPTLADGGEQLTDIRRVLGPTRYRRLILRFLG